MQIGISAQPVVALIAGILIQLREILNERLSVFSNTGDLIESLFLFFFSELLLGSGSNIFLQLEGFFFQ
jgi:hypothetical protein